MEPKESDQVACADVESVLEAAKHIGFPVLLSIKNAIDLSSNDTSKHSNLHSADLIRLAKNAEEAKVIAASMMIKTESDANHRRQQKIKELERGVFQLNAKLKALSSKIAGAKERDLATQVARRRDTIVDEIKQLKSSRSPQSGVIVSPASRQDSLFYGHEYIGHPMWDPELVSELMPCDFSTAALRAAYSGSFDLLRRLGVSRELRDEYEGLQARPAAIAAGMEAHRREIEQLETDRTSETHLAAARERFRAAQEEEPAARAGAARAARELALLERRCAAAAAEEYVRPRDDGRDPPAGDPRQADDPSVSAARRRAALAAAVEAREDERDRAAHPACMPPLPAQINAASHPQVSRPPARSGGGGGARMAVPQAPMSSVWTRGLIGLMRFVDTHTIYE